MRSQRPVLRCLLAYLVCLQTLMPSVASADHVFSRLKNKFVNECRYEGTEPCTGEDCAVEYLAENIDWLEHYIDTYGSIVAKQPDIWGEARLTKHRDEYERIMFGELNQFKSTINAAISQGDSSFLAQAVALSNAAAGTAVNADPAQAAERPTVAIANAQLKGAEDPSTGFTRFGISADRTPAEPMISLEPVIHLDQMSRYLQHLHELRRINEGDDTSDSPGYSMNLVRMPISILPGKLTREGFGAEVTVTATPVISDDLLPTTFRNLAVNDVVDQLGLPLVRVTEDFDRIAVSLKGKESEVLLDATINEIESKYRQFKPERKRDEFISAVIPAIEKLFQDQVASKVILDAFADLEKELEGSTSIVRKEIPEITSAQASNLERAVQSAVKDVSKEMRNILMQQQTTTLAYTVQVPQKRVDGTSYNVFEERTMEFNPKESLKKLTKAIQDEDAGEAALQIYYLTEVNTKYVDLMVGAADEGLAALTAKSLESLRGSVATVAPTGRTRRALNPLNPSSLEPVIGLENIAIVSAFFEPAYYGRHIRWNGSKKDCNKNNKEHRVNLLDARRFLQAEIEAAYELLSESRHLPLFAALAAPHSKLASQIRSGHLESDQQSIATSFSGPAVESYRYYFFKKLHSHSSAGLGHIVQPFAAEFCEASHSEALLNEIANVEYDEAKSSVEALAWAIVVESALLNERLNRDVRKLAKAKEAFDLNTQRDSWFFLPDAVNSPTPGFEFLQGEFQQATEVFKRYVEVRWPIHVFAIDPREQDQNVADVSQRKRELQFALALGFTTGQIGGNSLTQYSRELETQVETIGLNRTVVGFGHGNDTFGWRFHPRVQALDVPGTFGAICETLCGTSRDHDLNHRQLEPGQRECVAVVLMPSFVPYADFDIRSNWFKLTNPKKAALTMRESVRLSRGVTAMRSSRAQCAECQHLYRDGELRRLFKRVDQLDRELPLQTQRALVPYENTLGGFEMFNTGVTDLSPELIGWYGAPGINDDKDFNCGCYQGCQLVSGNCDGKECKELTTKLTAVDNRVKALEASAPRGPEQPLAPCEGRGTTLFLVGDNFSVHDTKVIAGGVCIPHVQLISREIMRVTIPSCVNQVTLCENGENRNYVAVYVATPYGVTNHLHVPVITEKKSEDLDEQLKAEVKKQVDEAVSNIGKKVDSKIEKSLEGYELPDRVISMTPADTAKKVLKLEAVDACDTPDETLYALKEARRVKVKYSRKDDPRFEGKTVTFSAVFKSGEFLGPLVEVARFTPLLSEQAFYATGPRHADLLDASTVEYLDAEVRLMQQLHRLDCTKKEDNKVELQLLFYATIEGQTLATPLLEPLKVEIEFPKSKQEQEEEAAGSEANGSSEATEVPEGPAEAESPVIEGPQVSPASSPEEALPPPAPVAPGQSRCNCGQEDATAILGNPRFDHFGISNRRVPARFAMQTVQFPSGATEADAAQFTELSNRLSQLETAVQQTAQDQANFRSEFQTALATQAQALEEITLPESLPAQSLVDIQVSAPPTVVVENRKKWCDGKSHPVVNRMKVRAGENWRNLRDKLPCN